MNSSLTAQPQSTSAKWYNQPSILLILCGLLIGCNFPLTKIAETKGISVWSWVLLSSLGSISALLPILLLKKQFHLPNRQQLLFSLVAGPVTFAGPNVLLYFVVPNVGAGYGGIMFALSPVMTVIVSRILHPLELSPLKLVGIGLGLLGAVGISFSRHSFGGITSLLWIAVAFSIPVLLAAGNVFRSIAWPKNSSPELLAFWSHLFALGIYWLVSLRFDSTFLQTIVSENRMVLTQFVIAGLLAPLAFRLQRFGGPVLFSQIGYIAAATSLAVSTLFLGEVYSLGSWLSAAGIGGGIFITLIANTQHSKKRSLKVAS